MKHLYSCREKYESEAYSEYISEEDYPCYFREIDSTHFVLSNSERNAFRELIEFFEKYNIYPKVGVYEMGLIDS